MPCVTVPVSCLKVCAVAAVMAGALAEESTATATATTTESTRKTIYLFPGTKTLTVSILSAVLLELKGKRDREEHRRPGQLQRICSQPYIPLLLRFPKHGVSLFIQILNFVTTQSALKENGNCAIVFTLNK